MVGNELKIFAQGRNLSNKVLKSQVKSLRNAIANINANISTLHSRLHNLEHQITAISAYLSEVSRIASNSNVPRYEPPKYQPIKLIETEEKLKEEEKANKQEAMSQQEINDALKGVRIAKK